MVPTRLLRAAGSTPFRVSAACSARSARIAKTAQVSLRALYSSSSSAPSSTTTVPLVFDHHEPPKSDRHRQDAPIIFMHGLFGSKKNNRSVCKVLARDLKRHVFALDLRNHGESPHSPRHDYTAMAEDVGGFIREHGLKNPTLIGHSMGAKTAMTLSLSSPTEIGDLVAVDNAPIDAALDGRFARYIRGMRHIEEAGVNRQADADEILREYEEELPIRQFLLGNMYRPSAQERGNGDGKLLKFRIPLDVLARSLGHTGDFPFKDPESVRFEKPALFVRGTLSKYVPDEVLPLIGRFFPRFQVADIEAGHWLISEKPEQFLRAVIEFLTPKE